MRFTDAHPPSAVCTPTRYALFTGRYAWRTRLQRNVLGPFSQPPIAEGQLTVPVMLRGQGYATAASAGGTSAGAGRNPAATASGTSRRRSPAVGTDVANYPPYCFIENDRTAGTPSAAPPVGRDAFKIAGPMVPDWELVEVLPTLEMRAVEHIQTVAEGDKPCFLDLSLTSPHYPVVLPAAFKGRSKVGDYGDFVMQTDHVVGEVHAALKRSGVAEKTLVILTSDNGPEITGEVNPGAYDRLKEFGHASMATFCGTKRDAWEGGHRAPFIARWPGKIETGMTCDETVCHVDLMATLAALLEVKLPADAGVDSVSTLPALLGENQNAPLREATVHYSGQGKFAIRRGDWVLILAPTGDDNRKQSNPPWLQKDRGYALHTEAGELFNLASDPAQTKNLYATRPRT